MKQESQKRPLFSEPVRPDTASCLWGKSIYSHATHGCLNNDIFFELRHRSLHLHAMQAVFTKHVPEFDLFKSMVAASNVERTLFRSSPFLDGSFGADELGTLPLRICGLNFNFSFMGEGIKPQRTHYRHTIYGPIVEIDNRVIDLLGEMYLNGRESSKEGSSPTEGVIMSQLKYTQDWIALAGHDFIHNLQNLGPTRFTHNWESEESGDIWDIRFFFESVPIDREDVAVFLTYALWEELHEKNPLLQPALLRRASNHLDKIVELRLEIAKTDPEMADKVAGYFTYLMATQLDIIMGLDRDATVEPLAERYDEMQLLPSAPLVAPADASSLELPSPETPLTWKDLIAAVRTPHTSFASARTDMAAGGKDLSAEAAQKLAILYDQTTKRELKGDNNIRNGVYRFPKKFLPKAPKYLL